MADQLNRSQRRSGISRSNSSLRDKLLLFAALLVLVPGLALILIAERNSRDSLRRIIGRQLAREAVQTADQLSSVLRAERATLDNFAEQDLMREIRVEDLDKRISMALRTLREGSPNRIAYLVIDRGARAVAASEPRMIGAVPAWLDPEWLGDDAGSQLRGPLALAAFEATIAVMTTPIRDPDNRERILGTLIGLFDWIGLTSVTERVEVDLASQGIAAEVLVCRADGAVIGGAGASAGRSADRSGIGSMAGGPAGAIFEPTALTEAGLIIGRAPLAPDLADHWSLLVVQSRARALAPARRLSVRLALTMGIALAIALALATLAARRVVRPLSELTQAIRRLSHTDARALRVPVRSDDEVGTLAAAFNDMAADLDRAQRDLIEAEKFAFVGELAAGVAHEIRTSLGVLGSSAQILKRSLPRDGGAEAAELAQMIRAEVGRLGAVVDNLLTLDRARPLVLEATRVSEPVFRAFDFVAPQASEKDIQMLRVPATREAPLLCEPELIYQVAVNLMVNALQVLESGGHLEVRILEAKDGFAGFEVWDDGPGIPEALRARIFQPFVTARDRGVGLGLTFVKRVVHDHRGDVVVESKPGSGTCFRVRIPVAGAEQ